MSIFSKSVRFDRSWWTGAIVLALVTASVAAAGFPAFTSPRLRRGIPARNYQYKLHSTPKFALSTTAELLEIPRGIDPDDPATGKWRRVRYFQLPIEKLEINDRKISRIAFQVESDGRWTLSLRGDFHEHDEDRAEPFVDAHLKRCRFRVKVRCFGAYPLGETAANLTAGKPVLFQTGPTDFWVQSGEPFDLWTKGNGAEARFARTYFEHLDRVEVEFSYLEAIGVTRPVRVVPPAR